MRNRHWIVMAGLAVTVAVAIYMVVRLSAQSATLTGDFSNAAIAEVRDAQGQVILQGQFAQVEEEDEDLERKAVLQPTGVDPDATGEAEVEVSKAAPASQEIEFSLRNVAGGATFALVIDGREVGSVTSNDRGEADVELNVSARPR